MDRKQDERLQRQFLLHAACVLVFLLLCRLIANYFIPLNDATEARYGEIARKMLETGNWVNLLHDYGIPFWAKPPLSTWLSALGMKLFGINEFAVRLPGLLLSIGTLALTGHLARKHSGSVVAALSVLILAGMFYFFLDAGTVMTDPSLLFCTTLSLVAFWQAVVNQDKLWSYLYFIGLGLGLLAKGPIAVVLVGLPVFLWVLLRKQWLNLWQRLPWIKGTLLALAIALPWYILAELRTPGFLNYFIVGEHVSRFLIPGWTGDKYGMAHHAPKGMIWLYALVGIFPWNILGARWLFKNGKKLPSFFRDDDGWMTYLSLCMLAPLLFFTFAGNIIYPYVFPALPAFALFFAELWQQSAPSMVNGQWILRFASFSGLLFLIVTLLFVIKPDWVAKTQKPLITAWVNQHPGNGSKLVYWDDRTEFSAQFYSAGKVRYAHDIKHLCDLLSNGTDNYLAIKAQLTAQIPTNLLAQCQVAKTIAVRDEKMLLLHCSALECSAGQGY